MCRLNRFYNRLCFGPNDNSGDFDPNRRSDDACNLDQFLDNTRNKNDIAGGMFIRLGARSIEYIAFEAHLEWVKGMKFTADRFDKLQAHRANPSMWTGTFNIKLFPLHPLLDGVMGGRFQPYIYGGFGFMVASDTTISTPVGIATRGGGGIDVFINTDWSINADASYVAPFGNVKGLRYTSLAFGATYHF